MSDEDVTEAAEEPAPEEPPAPPMAYGAPLGTGTGADVVVHPSVEEYPATTTALFEDGFVTLVDLTAVDYLTYSAARPLPTGVEALRFELVVQLLDPVGRRRVRVRVQVPADEPTVASIYDRFPGADAAEREVFDMFGITFGGHPDMTRILMPDDWVGHPLRKDFDDGRIPVQFTPASNSR